MDGVGGRGLKSRRVDGGRDGGGVECAENCFQSKALCRVSLSFSFLRRP